MADAAPIQPAPTRADVEAAGTRLAGRERFAPGAQLVLLGGRFIAELSDPLPADVFITEGVAAHAADDPLAALNEALSPRGYTISIPRGAEILEPITLLHLGDEGSSYSV